MRKCGKNRILVSGLSEASRSRLSWVEVSQKVRNFRERRIGGKSVFRVFQQVGNLDTRVRVTTLYLTTIGLISRESTFYLYFVKVERGFLGFLTRTSRRSRESGKEKGTGGPLRPFKTDLWYSHIGRRPSTRPSPGPYQADFYRFLPMFRGLLPFDLQRNRHVQNVVL